MEWFVDRFEEFIGVNFWTMIFAWCNILILYFFLRKLLFHPVKNMIDSRQAEIDGLYADAQKARTEAQQMHDEYEEKIGQAKDESEQILRDATRRAKLKEEAILKEAGEEAKRTQKRAEEQVQLEKKRALNEVKDEVCAMAIDIAGALISRDVDAKEHADMIDGFIRDLGDGK